MHGKEGQRHLVFSGFLHQHRMLGHHATRREKGRAHPLQTQHLSREVLGATLEGDLGHAVEPQVLDRLLVAATHVAAKLVILIDQCKLLLLQLLARHHVFHGGAQLLTIGWADHEYRFVRWSEVRCCHGHRVDGWQALLVDVGHHGLQHR